MNQQHRIATTGLAGAGLAALLTARVIRERRRVNFNRRSVVITGGSRGLGLALARAFAHEGARLTLLARDNVELEQVGQELFARGAEVQTIACDVRCRNDVSRAMAQVIERFGTIDVLVNNAGVIQVGPLDHMQYEDYKDAMEVHAWGPLYTALAALPHMRRQGGGRIVNISSIGGKVAVPHLLPYCMSKFALSGFSEGLRAELAAENILVTTVYPGLMRTGSHFNARFKGRHAGEFAWFSHGNALPIASSNVETAVRRIIAACRYGDARLIITPQARLLMLANTFVPGLFAAASALANRLLPAPTDAHGDDEQSGWASQSRWAPSLLTSLSDRAAEQYNGLLGRSIGAAQAPANHE